MNKQDPYASEADTKELIRIAQLPEPLRLAELLEQTMQSPLHGKAADCLRRMYAERQPTTEKSLGVEQQPAKSTTLMSSTSRPAAREPIPKGMKLVPVEPTKEMVKAFQDAMALEFGVRTTAGYHARVYSAMIAAAPQQKDTP